MSEQQQQQQQQRQQQRQQQNLPPAHRRLRAAARQFFQAADTGGHGNFTRADADAAMLLAWGDPAAAAAAAADPTTSTTDRSNPGSSGDRRGGDWQDPHYHYSHHSRRRVHRRPALHTLRLAFDRAFEAKVGEEAAEPTDTHINVTITADEFAAHAYLFGGDDRSDGEGRGSDRHPYYPHHPQPPADPSLPPSPVEVEAALMEGASVLCAGPGHTFEPWVLAVPLGLLAVSGFSAVYTTVG